MTDNKMVRIAGLLMVKNETDTIRRTIQSIVGLVSCVIVYDTGSTDETLSLLREMCDKYHLPLRLKEGVFQDFSTSRNILLEFADEFLDIDYYLLMDANDELRGKELLRRHCIQELHSVHTAWMVQQHWSMNTYSNVYFNIRLIRPHRHWRYKGVVHEFLVNMKEERVECPRCIPDICLFQDRSADVAKSKHRFPRDAELLLSECLHNPTDARSHFYLAQTYSSMGRFEDAYTYYLLRTRLQGFPDEVFHCWYRLGVLTLDLRREQGDESKYTWEVALGHFMKALECSMRVEPLVYLVRHYADHKKWELAYHFAKIACGLDYPESSLFVDRHMYHYTRFHLLGIVAFYCKRYKDGMVACTLAIERGQQEVDKRNLGFYEKVLNEPSSAKD